MTNFLLLFAFLIKSFALGDCPPEGAAFSMVYPAKVIFLSENRKAKEPQRIPATIATAIFNELKEDAPVIVFVGTSKTYRLLKRKVPDARLKFYEAVPALFQQDVFESFFSSTSKSIIIRPFQGYTTKNKGPDLKKLTDFLASENISATLGNPIDQYDGWVTGVGGNVESTAYGLNLIGSGEFSEKNLESFASGLFPNTSYTVFFDTSWLALGHIDEVMVELQTKKSSSGCKTTFLINSPQLGLKFQNKSLRELTDLNLQLQKKFDDYKTQLVKASEGKCNVDFIDSPILYQKASHSFRRAVYSTKYPSFTNGLLLKEKYFVVDPEDKELKTAFEVPLQKIGIKVVWLPLKKELYSKGVVDGYVHCLTNAIRICD